MICLAACTLLQLFSAATMYAAAATALCSALFAL
jgi:hypothetical protein